MEDENVVMTHGNYKDGYANNANQDLMEEGIHKTFLIDIVPRKHHHLLMSGNVERKTIHQHLVFVKDNHLICLMISHQKYHFQGVNT
eukprot:972780-Karenia_brevis.AAC.1